MANSQAHRSGNRSKFRSPQDIQAAMNRALGNAPEGDVIEGETVLTKTEETGQTTAASEARDVAITSVDMRPNVTSASCVRALEKAVGFGRSALYLEVSVSLAIFASSSTGADRATKRVVMDIYSQAGFDVSHTGPHYKTVNRRINASAALFDKLGAKAVSIAMRGMREGKAIESLSSYLGETYKFDSINAVLEFVGKPVEQTNTPEVRAARSAKEAAENNAVAVGINARIEQRRAERNKEIQQDLLDDATIVSAGQLSLVIPRDCTSAEIRAMVAKLNDFADRLDAEAGTPEEQRNREMHS